MDKEESKKFSIVKRKQSVGFALNGLKVFFKTQHNAWIHLTTAILVLIAGFILELTVTEWCLVGFAIGFVMVTEIINTAIEFLTDIVSPGYHEKAGEVKDIAAGAVLLASITAVVIGLVVFLPKVILVVKSL